MRAPSNQRGFSLLETLCVVGCISVAIGLIGGSTWHVQSSMALRNSAAEFLQTVKTARQYAIDHQCRTRVAFRAGVYSDDATLRAKSEERTYRIHSFLIPSSAPGDAGRWVAVTNEAKPQQTEWARVELVPRSTSMVGRWTVCELDPKAKQISDVIKVTSPLFDHFRDDEPDQFFADNFFTPETTWTETGADPYQPRNCLSVYPDDYRRTPTDLGPFVLTGELPEKEKCFDPFSGETVQATQFWPGTVRFIGGANKEGTAELPGVEFGPDGSLACAWTPQLEFTFAYEKQPKTNFVVVIDTATGLARIADAPTP